jgi:hypothetical protein
VRPPAGCSFANSSFPSGSSFSRLAVMRHPIGTAADQNLLVDARAAGQLLRAPQRLNHFLAPARQASAEVSF